MSDVRTLEEILFPEGLAPDVFIPDNPQPALNIKKVDIPREECSQTALQLQIAARSEVTMGKVFDSEPIKDETVTSGREGHFGRREATDQRDDFINQHGGEIDLGDWNDIKDAVKGGGSRNW